MMVPMWRHAYLPLTLLTACNQWVRPSPKPEHVRSGYEQRNTSVSVEMSCDPFGDAPSYGGRATGVMVSDWQVLTAIHVVDCEAAIPRIRVTDAQGNRYRFTPQREWRDIHPTYGDDGIALIQMASAESFSPSFPPPAVRWEGTQWYEPLYVQAAAPRREEVIGEATGMEYGGDTYGGEHRGRTFTYHAPTESGNSGSPVYDFQGYLVGIHIGATLDRDRQFGERIEQGMVP